MLKLIDQSLPDPECDPAARENLAEMFNGNMFTNADYLRALGHDDLLISKDGDLSPLLLSDRNSHLLSSTGSRHFRNPKFTATAHGFLKRLPPISSSLRTF